MAEFFIKYLLLIFILFYFCRKITNMADFIGTILGIGIVILAILILCGMWIVTFKDWDKIK